MDGNGIAVRTEATTAPLARAIALHLPRAGDVATAVPELSLHRRDAPTQPVDCTYGLGLIVTTQGAKQVILGDRVVEYRPGQSMLTTLELPITSHVMEASVRAPYLGLLLKLDIRAIAVAAGEIDAVIAAPGQTPLPPASIETLDPRLLDALERLVALLDDPLRRHLAGLVRQEIVLRLLAGPHGPLLRRLVAHQAPREQIGAVIAWLKANFTQTFRIEDLAGRAHMSPSTFRQHFRAVAGMSPLQYQKQLRLQEARQLMLNRSVTAGRAAVLVGYESGSQFSREYSRLFGAPPQRDVQRLRSN